MLLGTAVQVGLAFSLALTFTVLEVWSGGYPYGELSLGGSWEAAQLRALVWDGALCYLIKWAASALWARLQPALLPPQPEAAALLPAQTAHKAAGRRQGMAAGTAILGPEAAPDRALSPKAGDG
eukprot:SAG22_NODE_964_length_6277_cov_12.416316_2_plen_124_part_00